MIESLVKDMIMTQKSRRDLKITQEEYDAWRDSCVFDALRGVRCGQSFCNQFDITDYILFYEVSEENADRYIQKTYVKRKS